MKHNWTYKKLGEVVIIERGGSPRPIQDYITTDENGLNWIKIGDAVEGSKYITSTKEKIKPEGLKKTRFVHKGDFILSNSMSFGRPYILGIDGCIHDGWLVLHDEKEIFDKSYLYYYLSSPSIYAEFKRLAVGGVVNNLNSDIVRKVRVAIPSKEEQQAIVGELDGIHHLIDLQEEQLREYDHLAQSLFYSTFGDPATNPKGWEVKSLGDIAEPTTGITYSPDDVADDGIIVLRSSNIQDNKLDFENVVRVKKNVAEKYYVKAGDILMCSRNGSFRLVGKTALVDNLSEKMTWGAFMTIIRSNYNPYLLQYFRTPAFREQLTTAKTTTVNQITIGMLKKIQLPIPPADLQQSFAAQIEAIEQQKALVRKSLEETRTLLAARMQYYFE